MKKIIAISALSALLLAGCGKAAEPKKAEDKSAVQTVTEATEPSLPEQVITAEKSPLTGFWEGTISMGDVAAARFLKTIVSETEAAEKAAAFAEVTYPIYARLELMEDGQYYFEIKPDTVGAGFASFVTSFHRIMQEQGLTGYTEDQLWELMTAEGLDQLPTTIEENHTGTWEQNDQGLFLSQWCTVQYTLEGEYFHWTGCDDPEFQDMMPITFR